MPNPVPAEENVAELKAEILKLTEERNSALAQLEKETVACVSVSDTLVSTRRIARELKAENERLREALKPFASAADAFHTGWLNHESHWSGKTGLDLTVGHLRRARAALSQEPRNG